MRLVGNRAVGADLDGRRFIDLPGAVPEADVVGAEDEGLRPVRDVEVESPVLLVDGALVDAGHRPPGALDGGREVVRGVEVGGVVADPAAEGPLPDAPGQRQERDHLVVGPVPLAAVHGEERLGVDEPGAAEGHVGVDVGHLGAVGVVHPAAEERPRRDDAAVDPGHVAHREEVAEADGGEGELGLVAGVADAALEVDGRAGAVVLGLGVGAEPARVVDDRVPRDVDRGAGERFGGTVVDRLLRLVVADDDVEARRPVDDPGAADVREHRG